MAFDKSDKDFISEAIGNALAGNNEILIDFIEHRLDQIKQDSTNDKNEILGAIADFSKEIATNREERTVQAEQISRNTKRIDPPATAVL